MRLVSALIYFFSITLLSQTSVSGTINPSDDISWILLYQIENGNEVYIDNSEVNEGEFAFKLPQNQNPGFYRAYYNIEDRMFVEFLFDQKDIHFTFNPKNPLESLVFKDSKSNDIYRKYYREIYSVQKKLDSIQIAYFRNEDAKLENQYKKQYDTRLKSVQKTQKDFEEISKNTLAYPYIKASAQYNDPEPIKQPSVYLESARQHFFDAVDFSDPDLKNSSFLSDKMTDYIFYLNQAENPLTANDLQKEAIVSLEEKLKSDNELKEKLYRDLVNDYLAMENILMVNYTLERYNLLPHEYKNFSFLDDTQNKLKTAVGTEAPNIFWKVNELEKSLYNLIGSDYYIIVFFSSTCSHCIQEMPAFHDFIQEVGNLKVIAIGLEDSTSFASYQTMTEGFTDFINIMEEEKWGSQIAKDYGVTAVPSFFILDADKTIIAKPDNTEELKALFGG